MYRNPFVSESVFMKRICFLLLSAILVSSVACKRGATGLDDYDQEIYRPRYASGFEIVRPDVVLHDLIAIMHPEVLDENDRGLYYYQRLE